MQYIFYSNILKHNWIKKIVTYNTTHFIISSWYKNNYQVLKAMNPKLPLLLRTTENAMPAVTTELDFTMDDLLKYMLQTNKFQNEDGSTALDRVEAAKAYLKTDWATLRRERWAHAGFDPEHPLIDEEDPDWKLDPKKSQDLATYIELKESVDEQLSVLKGGQDNEFTRAENSLLMCQRVDLWCAGEKEVEQAVKHLNMLGKRFNHIERQSPREYIEDFYPGASDF